MNYKELTDEELLKTMEFCIKKEECGKDCRLFNVQGCMWNMFNQSFELIQRLQNKNKLLNISLKNECEEHKKFVKLAKEVDEEQKAEIERLEYALLEAKNNMLEYGTACVKEGYEKAKEQIEQLMKENEGQRKIIEYQDSVEDKNAELQKQVDELMEELDFYKCANRELTSTNEMLKGIVKNKGVEVE